MTDPVITMTEEVNGVTLQLPEDGYVGFSTAIPADASDSGLLGRPTSGMSDLPDVGRPPEGGDIV